MHVSLTYTHIYIYIYMTMIDSAWHFFILLLCADILFYFFKVVYSIVLSMRYTW